MKNTITASVHFSFKGEQHTLSIRIELDEHLRSSGKLPNFHPLIANKNNFDLYSYEYEIMQSVEIIFSEPTGLISQFIINGQLNTDAFISTWQENQRLEKLLNITKEYMNITDLEQHPDLKKAMLAAYQLGKQDIT